MFCRSSRRSICPGRLRVALFAGLVRSGFYCSSSQHSNPYNLPMDQAHLDSMQKALQQHKLDGWLFYSFRGSDPIAENILRLDHAKFTTRRWFYFVPSKGTPQKIVHAIEEGTLDNLPGNKRVYLPWQQLHQHLRETLSGAKKVAMQYSPLNAIPYISRVDAEIGRAHV